MYALVVCIKSNGYSGQLRNNCIHAVISILHSTGANIGHCKTCSANNLTLQLTIGTVSIKFQLYHTSCLLYSIWHHYLNFYSTAISIAVDSVQLVDKTENLWFAQTS